MELQISRELLLIHTHSLSEICRLSPHLKSPGVFLEFHQPSRFEGVKTRFTQISRSAQFNREKQNRISGWAQVAVDATIRGNPISPEEMGRTANGARREVAGTACESRRSTSGNAGTAKGS